MASWYRRFVENFSRISAPLTRLTGKNARWQWGEAEKRAFQQLKTALTTAHLACPDYQHPFVLQTEDSTQGLGAVLTQNFAERVIAYASRTLNPAEKNYSATRMFRRRLGHTPHERLSRGVSVRGDYRSPITPLVKKPRQSLGAAGALVIRITTIRFRISLPSRRAQQSRRRTFPTTRPMRSKVRAIPVVPATGEKSAGRADRIFGLCVFQRTYIPTRSTHARLPLSYGKRAVEALRPARRPRAANTAFARRPDGRPLRRGQNDRPDRAFVLLAGDV